MEDVLTSPADGGAASAAELPIDGVRVDSYDSRCQASIEGSAKFRGHEPSDDPMACKQLSCLSIPRRRGVAHVDHGGLDIVPSTVLHKGHIGSCIQQTHCDRMAQRMKAPFGLRNSGPLAMR